jgi:hypothetical protein
MQRTKENNRTYTARLLAVSQRPQRTQRTPSGICLSPSSRQGGRAARSFVALVVRGSLRSGISDGRWLARWNRTRRDHDDHRRRWRDDKDRTIDRRTRSWRMNGTAIGRDVDRLGRCDGFGEFLGFKVDLRVAPGSQKQEQQRSGGGVSHGILRSDTILCANAVPRQAPRICWRSAPFNRTDRSQRLQNRTSCASAGPATVTRTRVSRSQWPPRGSGRGPPSCGPSK